MLVQWYFYCNMFVHPLASWAPAREAPSLWGGGGSCTIPCRKFGQGLNAVHKQQNSASLTPLQPACKGDTRKPVCAFCTCPQHPRPGPPRPVPAPSTSRSLAMVRWGKANFKSRFQPCGCRSGPRRVSQPLPRPAEGCFGEKTRGPRAAPGSALAREARRDFLHHPSHSPAPRAPHTLRTPRRSQSTATRSFPAPNARGVPRGAEPSPAAPSRSPHPGNARARLPGPVPAPAGLGGTVPGPQRPSPVSPQPALYDVIARRRRRAALAQRCV